MIIGEHCVATEVVLGGSIRLLAPSFYEVRIERNDLEDLVQFAHGEKEAQGLLAKIEAAVTEGQATRMEYAAASGGED